MFSPPLYTVRKIHSLYIINKLYNINVDKNEEKQFYVLQQDNPLFRQIRLITETKDPYNPYIIFVSLNHSKKYIKDLSELILNGFTFNGIHFICSERSASMTRQGILSFVDSRIFDKLNKRVTMGICFDKTVLSKYYAYRGLMLSSCHCLEGWFPKIIIVADYFRTIPQQRIKYVYDSEWEYVDKEGNPCIWKQKDIAETTRDIQINVFDGCGIHHKQITQKVKEMIKTSDNPTSILWRAPFIKGMTHEMDYVSFFDHHGVKEITDIWGVKHAIHGEPMIIMTQGMYKGKPYFEKYADDRDWHFYWSQFKAYDHCLGIAKWNFGVEEEPVYTRANYQILQDLDLPFDHFATLAKYTIDWISKIIDGDPLYTHCFLGLYANSHHVQNHYTKAILKNPEMLKEHSVRNYIISLIEKYLDEMKCGKLWLKSCFKILVPDLILFLEWIGGLQPKGALKEDEFFTFGKDGIYHGEYLIERNPHICKSEHTLLHAVSTPLLTDYCSHLSNTCMINGNSITPQRLNGADFDGDLVLVIDDKVMKQGVDTFASVVIDIDDKVTSLAQEDTPENRLSMILRTMNSLIGETSNCATAYHNKMPSSTEQKRKYESYLDLLSVINGKSIDYAKTGIFFQIPRHIAKYGTPLPYFMKYAGEYYRKQRHFLKSKSNMNRLCMAIEKWEKTIRYKRNYKDFNYRIMIDDSIPLRKGVFHQIETVYLDFCAKMSQLTKDQASIRETKEYKDFILNWQQYYDQYQNLCDHICPNPKELANIAITLCYETYPNKNKKFPWRVAAQGILLNLKQMPIMLPMKDPNGNDEYLGNQYTFFQMEENQ